MKTIAIVGSFAGEGEMIPEGDIGVSQLNRSKLSAHKSLILRIPVLSQSNCRSNRTEIESAGVIKISKSEQ
jgi:hypothetical protein